MDPFLSYAVLYRLIAIGSASVKVSGVYLNGRLYSLKIRIPNDLKNHYPKQSYLQHPLKTSDYSEAVKIALPVLERWKAEFKALKEGRALPHGAITSLPIGDDISSVIGNYDLVVDALEDRLHSKAEAQATKEGYVGEDRYSRAHEIYELELSGDDAINQAEKRLLISKGYYKGSYRLSDALQTYLDTHPKKDKASINNSSRYAMDSLINGVGDLKLLDPFLDDPEALSRSVLQEWIKNSLKKGGATGTIARQLTQIKAIVQRVKLEKRIPNLGFITEGVSVPNEGSDAKVRHTPSAKELKDILEVFKDDPIVILLVHLGARAAEVSGLMKQDIHLDYQVPYLSINPNIVRSLKTVNSQRDVPLVGAAFDAAKELLRKAQGNSSDGLFNNYFKPRGSDTFSATVNKRLRSKGFSKITTHCFRHGLKDLLREASVPKSLIDEIQGHGSQEISRSYGKGYSLDRKAESLMSAYALINAG